MRDSLDLYEEVMETREMLLKIKEIINTSIIRMDSIAKQILSEDLDQITYGK